MATKKTNSEAKNGSAELPMESAKSAAESEPQPDPEPKAEPEARPDPDPQPEQPKSAFGANPGRIVSHEEAMANYRKARAEARAAGEDLAPKSLSEHQGMTRRRFEQIVNELRNAQLAVKNGQDPSIFINRAIGVAGQ